MRYRDLEPIGDGGQGSVYRATNAHGDRVAIKYMNLHEETSENAHFRHRFRREVEVLRGLDHPGIVRVIDFDTAAPIPFYVMPLAEKTLRTVLDEAPLSLSVAEDYFRQILEAVRYAHSVHVVHRDLKPENVLLAGGALVLSDFGLGRDLFSPSSTLTRDFTRGGSPEYSAPEQLRDLHSADERSDVFSLSQILFELITGLKAFYHYQSDLVPERLRSFVTRSRQLEPSDRFPDANVMYHEFCELASTWNDQSASTTDIDQLLDLIGGGDATASRMLLRTLAAEPLNLDLHRPLFTATAAVLKAMSQSSQLKFGDLSLRLVQLAEAEVEANSADEMAYLFSQIFELASPPTTRTRALEALLKVAAEFPGWYTADRLIDVLNSIATVETLSLRAEQVWETHSNLAARLSPRVYDKITPDFANRLRRAAA